MEYAQYPHMARRALGRQPAGLVLRGGRVLNVFSGEILTADVAIEGDTIVGVGSYAGQTEIDLQGRFVVPGFIDAHLHLESTLAPPGELVAAALSQGTTTLIADPHEAANVAGEAGIDYLLAQTEGLPANVFFMMPSCVPTGPLEENGCVLTAARMAAYVQNPRILGLGEVMDYTAVLEAEPAMLDKLALFETRVKDGHAPGLSQKQLAAYALAGIQTDHECTDYDYAMEQVRNGMYVLIREGSGARNLAAIVGGIVRAGTDTSRFAFCTDDKHIGDIRREGHISHNIRKSIALGLSPVAAIRMATLNPATCYGLGRLGAVAPGYRADLVVLDDLETVDIHEVYCAGQPVDTSAFPPAPACPPGLLRTVHLPPLAARDLALPAGPEAAHVIGMVDGQIVTRHLREAVPTRDGLFVPEAGYSKAVVIERHRATGHLGVAAVRGFGITGGAMGTTLSHDSHNLVVIGDSDAAIMAAIKALDGMQGGYVLVAGDTVAAALPLPVMGLMRQAGQDAEAAEEALGAMARQAVAMGVPPGLDPFNALSFIALPVIPSLRLTTRGLYDVEAQRLL